jgi:glycosyltransferase involved in cell wall biosynthesis
MTTFSTVIATRNRPDALALALPLHLAQSRLPERILVIDGSDDPSANAALVDRLAAAAPVPIEHQVSRPGASLQRNLGLAQVTSDVTFLPDDDSLVHPGATEAILRVYDRDASRRIGGVAGLETRRRPDVADPPAYAMRRSDRIKAWVKPVRTRIEDRLVPDPMKVAARRRMDRLPLPEPWLGQEGAVPVEWMTGFRMSFRTDLVRAVGFNENLGRYALFEDVDAGLGVLRTHLLVTTANALIYHYKAPENRASGRQMGAIHLLNRAYVACRHAEADARLHGVIRRHARFRLMQYRLDRSPFGQERLMGARAAFRALPELLAAGPGALDETYLRLRRACLGEET